jgi:dTDP-4-dehydrorhamnose reductase
MSKSPILITGASGQLGWHLCRFFVQAGYSVHGVYHSRRPQLAGVELMQCDLADRPSLEKLDLTDYHAVIHAAAMASPDECEKAPDLAHRTNVEAARLLVERRPPESRFVFISTDLVFDGRQGNYDESDATEAVNTYAANKIEAEGVVRGRPGAVILRMALLYGPPAAFPGGFVAWMRARLAAGQEVPLYVDQYRTPVYVGDVARALELLLEGAPRQGLYHLGGADRLSRWQFGKLYAQVFREREDLLRPVEIATVVETPRGLDCSLDSSRFAREFGFRPVGVREGLERMKKAVY